MFSVFTYLFHLPIIVYHRVWLKHCIFSSSTAPTMPPPIRYKPPLPVRFKVRMGESEPKSRSNMINMRDVSWLFFKYYAPFAISHRFSSRQNDIWCNYCTSYPNLVSCPCLMWRIVLQVPKGNILPLAHNEQDVQLGKAGLRVWTLGPETLKELIFWIGGTKHGGDIPQRNMIVTWQHCQTLVAAKPHRVTADQIETGRKILRRCSDSRGKIILDNHG